MRCPMLSQVIRRFIDWQIGLHPQIEPWLSDWCMDHETQICIDKSGLVSDTFVTASGHKYTGWYSDDPRHPFRDIRIPRKDNATNEYTFSDFRVTRRIDHYWELIGTSGWNWREQKSMWVGFDFDSIVGHKEGLDPDQIREVLDRARQLPYVTARTSKSGTGIHLLAKLDPWVSTRNRKQHKQLAMCVLIEMSNTCGFDFNAAADVGGGNLWSWWKGVPKDGLRRIGA